MTNCAQIKFSKLLYRLKAEHFSCRLTVLHIFNSFISFEHI